MDVIKIVEKRKIWYIISALVIICGLISLFTQRLNLGIDFTGGNITEVKLKENVTTAQVRDVVQAQGLTSNYIQESADGIFLIRTEVLNEKQSAELLQALEQELGDVTLLRSKKVGPTIGAELAQKALLSFAIAAVLMTLYITWRFEFKQGLAVMVGIVHDVLVTLGIVSILQLEVDSAFVAAILTIVGYTINNTIIIFDRIRENMRLKRGLKTVDLINLSIRQTLARSINTVLAVLFVLVSLFLFGGSTIKTFVLILIIGIVAGLYSSLFVTCSLWYDMLDSKRKKKVATA